MSTPGGAPPPSGSVQATLGQRAARLVKEAAVGLVTGLTTRRPRSEQVELACRFAAELNDEELAELFGRSLHRELLLQTSREFLARATPQTVFRFLEDMHELALGHQASVDHVLATYGALLAPLDAWGRPLAGARVLELGPGFSKLGGALLLAWGAASYDAVDPFPVAVEDPALLRALRGRLRLPTGLPVQLEEPLRARLRHVLERFDGAVWSEAEGRLRPDAPLRLHHADAASLPLADGSLDLVVSNAVLEHVRDLPGIAREAARVLAPGGLSVHQVDFRDHRDFSRPREFLQVSAAEWEETTRAVAFDYTNRLRLSEVRAAFASAGFELLTCEVNESRPLAPGELERLHPDFRARSVEDLEALGARLVWRRPG